MNDTLRPDQIDDLVLGTLPNIIGEGAFTGLQTDLSDFPGVNEIFEKRVSAFHGGLPWEVFAQVDHAHSAIWTGLFAQDSSGIGDNMKKLSVSPRYLSANFIYDVLEPQFQMGGKAIYDLLETRKVATLMSVFIAMEEAIWKGCQSSSDKRTMFGMDYWFQSGEEGFNGGDNPNFPEGCGGLLNADANNRFANWTDQYDDMTKDELVGTMRTAYKKIRFKSPLKVNHKEPSVGNGRGIYTTQDVIEGYENLIDVSNTNLGNDLGGENPVFKKHELVDVPMLEDDTTNPIHFIDWSTVVLGVQPGWKMKESKPEKVAGSHNVRQVFYDVVCNMMVVNKRLNAKLTQV